MKRNKLRKVYLMMAMSMFSMWIHMKKLRNNMARKKSMSKKRIKTKKMMKKKLMRMKKNLTMKIRKVKIIKIIKKMESNQDNSIKDQTKSGPNSYLIHKIYLEREKPLIDSKIYTRKYHNSYRTYSTPTTRLECIRDWLRFTKSNATRSYPNSIRC